MMKKNLLTFLLTISLTCLISSFSFANEQVITDAGREAIINNDGSWSFVSDDRYATNAAGERVKLKSDGSWEILSVDENLSTAHSAVYRNAPDYKAVEFKFDNVIIESSRTKASTSSKNTQLKSQTIFHVLVSVPDSESEALQLDSSMKNLFSINDTADDEYPILSISPASLTIEPGSRELITVRVDGAPGWKYGKSYEFTVSAGLINSDRDLTLRIPLSETKKIEVDGFED